MEMKYWVKNAENPEWILRSYMEMTDYTYHHTDLGMMDLDFAEVPADERLDYVTESLLSGHAKEIEKEYAKDMAQLLNGFFNMSDKGMYAGCVNEGKVTDLSEKDGFNALFVKADRHMSEEFIEEGGHAWDGILDGYPLRFIKYGDGRITLIQILSQTEHRRIYKAYIREYEGTNVLFTLCHCACEFPIND